MLTLVACSGAANDSARQATQTPWIIYVSVTTTPEPAIITPLPTVTTGRPAATIAPTRAAVATRPAPTRTTTPAPIAQPTATQACNLGTVQLKSPEDGAPRNFKRDGGGIAFIFEWQPPATVSGPGDPKIGYQVDMTSRRQGTGTVINGARRMISNNKFHENGLRFIFDRDAVKNLAGGDNASVAWTVTVVKALANFDDANYLQVPVVVCGPPTPPRSIQLIVED